MVRHEWVTMVRRVFLGTAEGDGTNHAGPLWGPAWLAACSGARVSVSLG